ncbi:RNA polymerase II subunit A C-terminal domain phosphatase [Cimex lectularius]|uniref:RNA polymerase II subunit A C-terminal domain phosphatase n=1 Tax=Cimex lectularius TaxID=79782 RepID=A0A8I6SPC2_CIMLE|nr:RNA polymerase II subunit A C-terminal domain phosphatase [Cimex lectularius]
MPDKVTIRLATADTVKITKWKVEEGTIVYDGRILMLYEESGGGKQCKMKSKNVGTVAKLLAKEGDTVRPGEELLEIAEGCSHPTVINDLCAECGADLQKEGSSESQATIPMIHSIPQLKVSHEQAQLIGKADTDRLIRDRKLVLLVDLDQTLIHTTHDNVPNNIKDVHHFQLSGSFHWYHTRLRPGTRKFLKRLAPLYELHICTFGVRSYAHTVARILDENGSLFSHRILSRDECFDSNSKFANLQALFPCGDELVCIIDDREDVWNYSPNLIQVKPYLFFKNTGDIHDPSLACPPAANNAEDNFLASGLRVKEKKEKTEEEGKDNGESVVKKKKLEKNDNIEVEDSDDYLLYLESILKRVHKRFYRNYDKKIEGGADVKKVIVEERSEVLKGCEIVLSGLVPLKVPLDESVAAQMAMKLGATIAQELGPNTTHLIAAVKGTAKVHQARKMKGVSVVSPHWLIASAQRWERVDERLYDVGTGGPPIPFCKSLQPKGIPQFISLSQEEMDEMALEVGEDSDNDENDDDKEEEIVTDTTNSDGEEEWSELGKEIEKGLSDFM